MKLYKGFNKDLKCRDFQFEVGKEYEEAEADICRKGFHACENPLDVFDYYPPSDSRYCEVELDVNEQTQSCNSKRVGKKIKINAEIGLPGIIKAGVEYIKERVDWENSKESNTGYRSAATNTGCQSAATNTGDQSAATNTGDRSAATNTGCQSAATNTGCQSAATNTGFQSAAIVSGVESIAISTGYEGKAKGALGCFIVLSEWKEIDGEYHIVDVKSSKVDGKNIKPNVFYTLVDGKFVETK